MEDRDLEKLEHGNPILEVAVELGIKIKSNTGICFRSDRHADVPGEFTLFFDLAKNSFFCKDCRDVGGNVIDLVCLYRGCDREKAINWLKHRIEFDLETRELYYQKNKKGKRK
ncbi:MAG: hypothetical protein LJE96_16370 [Deltaproteobacteria bacterium]|nr:hypothetical protein [Deltaproteobacteria bacterium]